MSATEDLRRMLDERGIPWCEGGTPEKTIFQSSNWDVRVSLTEGGGGMLLDAGYGYLTFEQAIAATLGPRKAHKVIHTEDGIIGRCTCDGCGRVVHRQYPRCPWCGAIFEEGE